jgi:GTP-binding protein HflX
MRAILVGVKTNKDKKKDLNYSLSELEGLVNALDGKTLGKLYQIKSSPEASTYIGKGKAIQLKELADGIDADTIIFDVNLSPVQIRNLEDITGREVLDRTDLILKIFEKRAKTKQAKLQVELAILEHELPRAYNQKGKELSRIGGRGKIKGAGEHIGEIKIRKIKKRISKIKRELKEIEKQRREQRKKRNKSPNIVKVSLVGYTNVGKSSLLKKLTKRDVFVSDKLFATLDTRTSFISFPDINKKILLTDTVGFVKDMPEELMDAFSTTLEELREADLILHVVDISDENWEEKLKEVEKILEKLKLYDKDILIVLNKIDKLIPSKEYLEDDYITIDGKQALIVSVNKGWNLDKLTNYLYDFAKNFKVIN